MIYALHGIVHRLFPPHLSIEVHDIEYIASVPLPVWEKMEEGSTQKLFVYTYVREDRLDLFGFLTSQERLLFSELISLSGVGPKLGLELCSISRNTLAQAIATHDSSILMQVKGVGKKTAEKLLLDLKSLYEKHPDSLQHSSKAQHRDAVDRDALAALIALGYDQSVGLQALHDVPPTIEKTEERVTVALRGLSQRKKHTMNFSS